MMKRETMGWRARGLGLALLCLGATGAQAQGPVPRPVPAPVPNVAPDGSVTADGVTYSAEDIADLVAAYLGDKLSLPDNLPMPVRMEVYKRASAPSPLPPPVEGGGL